MATKSNKIKNPDRASPKLHVVVPLCWTEDEFRNIELANCIRANISNPEIDTFHILSEDHGVISIFPDRTIPLVSRPTYSDWLRFASTLPEGDIALLANSDILLENGLNQIKNVFDRNDKLLVAATRHEFDYNKHIVSPHPNPKCSQDVWAFRVNASHISDLIDSCDVQIGVQGCDNRIAFIFSDIGFSIINPYFFVQFIHYHKSGKKVYCEEDCPFSSGMAYVSPALSLSAQSNLQFKSRY
jgi:hypothetical protein